MDNTETHLSEVAGTGAGPDAGGARDGNHASSNQAGDTPDRAFIRRALEQADLDAVKIALYQSTDDATLKALPLARDLTATQRDGLIDTATDWLIANASPSKPRDPSDARLRELMEMAVGGAMGDLEFEARRDLPGFRDYPFMVEWAGPPPAIPEGFRVVVIGSGFAGVGMGVQLDRLGIPYIVLERRAEAGGVWSINRYPDVRVDTSSITYEFMFEKEYIWGEYFGRGAEVQRYIDTVSRKFGVYDKTRFGHDVQEARFDKARNLWTLSVDTATGRQVIEANVVISCSGLFANPNMPEFEGLDSFEGQILHPARWDPDADLAGKRVATIGNGSTGVQMLGSVARQAAQVHVFQRTPQWIMPRLRYGQPIEPEVNWLLRHFPGYANWWRFTSTAPLFDTHDLMQVDEDWKASGGKVNRASDALREELIAYLSAQTGGRADLIERLTPDYAPLSRRPVVDNGWYKALTQDHVELVTDPIERLVPEGIQTRDGKIREVDVIITATGYRVEQYLWPTRYIGCDGVDLHARWTTGDGPRAYIGMLVPDFPNLFILYGPNSQPISGGPAQPVWFAVWSSYVARCLMKMLEDGSSSVEVKRDAFERYNVELDAAARSLVQMTTEGGVDKNYYVNHDHVRLQVNAPWYSPRYHQLCTEVTWDDLLIEDG